MELGDVRQIHAVFERGDRALMGADIEELSRIFADDYVQYDESGKAYTKHDVLENLKSGRIRYISMVSTCRQVRLFGDFAIVHGSEDDEVEQAGKRFPVHYVYMDVVIKHSGMWQIVGSQLAKPA